jgi:hypothetical protein
MPGVAASTWIPLAIGVGGQVVSGALASRGAGKAADAQVQASRESLELQKYIFDTQQANLAPWLQTGQQGLGALSYGMGLPGPSYAQQPYTGQGPYQGGGAAPQPAAQQGSTGGGGGQYQIVPQALYDQLQASGKPLSYEGDQLFGTAGYLVQRNDGTYYDPQTGQDVSNVGQPNNDMGLSFQTATVGQQAGDFQPQQLFAGAGGGPQDFTGTGIQQGEFSRRSTGADVEQYLNPYRDFVMNEGIKALGQSKSAQTMFQSGGAIKGAAKYLENLSNQRWDDAFSRMRNEQDARFNRMASIAGIGQTATTQLNQAAGDYGFNAGNLITGAGNARASGYAAGGSIWGNTVGNIANTAAQGASLLLGGPSKMTVEEANRIAGFG